MAENLIRDVNLKGLFIWNQADESNYIPGDVVYKDSMLQVVNSNGNLVPWLANTGYTKDGVLQELDRQFSPRKSLPEGHYTLSSATFREKGYYPFDGTTVDNSSMDGMPFSRGAVITLNNDARLFVSDTHIRFSNEFESHIVDINTGDQSFNLLRRQVESILRLGPILKEEVKNKVKFTPISYSNVNNFAELPGTSFTGFIMYAIKNGNTYTSKSEYIYSGKTSYPDFTIQGNKLIKNVGINITDIVAFDTYGNFFS